MKKPQSAHNDITVVIHGDLVRSYQFCKISLYANMFDFISQFNGFHISPVILIAIHYTHKLNVCNPRKIQFVSIFFF